MDAPLKRIKTALFIALAGLLAFGFTLNPLRPNPIAAPAALPSPTATRRPHDTPAPPPTLLFTATPSATPTFISGVLSCDTTAPGVTCTNYGTYLDYNINIVVTGLTGGATAYNNFVGTFKRADGGGYLGMKSDFWHGETSGYGGNTVLSMVRIQQNGYARVDYASFTSGAGYNVSVHNQTDEWKDVPGSNPAAQNFLTVRGNVDWPITGYSVVGHIYLYSNQNFMTVTPTSTATATFTPTNTGTPTSSPTFTPIPGTPQYNGSGTCWKSLQSWPSYSVTYRIDASIPATWESSIHNAANTWTNVSPSPFSFVNFSQTPYVIKLGHVEHYYEPAYTWYAFIGWTLTDVYTIFNDQRPFDPNLPVSPTSFSVQETMTHEIGHWLVLEDMNAACPNATMFNGFQLGETFRITLDAADENGINWQYP